MQGTSFEFTISHLPQAQAYAGAMLARAQDTQPLMVTIADLGEQSTKSRIERTNLAPDGTKWKPSIRVKTSGGTTLFQYGNLANSFSHEGTATQALWGTNLLQARILQFGGTILPKIKKALRFRIGNRWLTVKKVTIPARAFIGASEQDRRDWTDAANAFFLPPAPRGAS